MRRRRQAVARYTHGDEEATRREGFSRGASNAADLSGSADWHRECRDEEDCCRQGRVELYAAQLQAQLDLGVPKALLLLDTGAALAGVPHALVAAQVFSRVCRPPLAVGTRKKQSSRVCSLCGCKYRRRKQGDNRWLYFCGLKLCAVCRHTRAGRKLAEEKGLAAA